MKSYKQSYFDSYVSTHIKGRKDLATHEEFALRSKIYERQLGPFLVPDKAANILDIGCGNGSVVWWLQENGYKNVAGFDISAEQIEVGVRLGVKNIECADIRSYLHSRKDHFDMLIARDVFEHFHKSELTELLSLCQEALVSSGKLLLQGPNAESPLFGRIRYGDFTHEIAFTSSSLSQMLLVSGFTEVVCYPCNPVFHRLISLPRYLLWKLFESVYKAALFAELGNAKIARIVTQNLVAIATKR